MLRRVRLLVTAGPFAVCLMVSLAAAVAVFRQGVRGVSPPDEYLPRPSAAEAPAPPSGEPELGVLVSQDLTQSSREQQLAMAAQLEQLLRTRRDWRPMDQNLNPEQLRRLQENLIELLRVWFLSKADQFAALERSKRDAFLDDLLGLVDAFAAVAQSAPRQAIPTAKAKSPASLDGRTKAAGTPTWMNLLAKMQERTTAEEQPKAIGLGMALQERRQIRAKKQVGKQTRSSP